MRALSFRGNMIRRALYSESAGRSSKFVSSSINCFNAINALLDGDRARALS
ncbi:MAG: hypothetical protein AAYR33_00820 [Acetobacteraceae bacterium]